MTAFMHGCRSLESKLKKCSLGTFSQEFRSICDAAITHSVSARSGPPQAVSLLLDHGNQCIASLEPSSVATSPAADPEEPEDPFWMGVTPDVSSLLSLQVTRFAAYVCITCSLFSKPFVRRSNTVPNVRPHAGRHVEAWVSGVLQHSQAKSLERNEGASKHTTVTLTRTHGDRRLGRNGQNDWRMGTAGYLGRCLQPCRSEH